MAVVNVMTVYLRPDPLAEASAYHAPGVGLDGQDGPQTAPEGLPHQEAAAAGLDERDAEAGFPVAPVVLPGPADGLKAQEAGLHLKDRNSITVLLLVNQPLSFITRSL